MNQETKLQKMKDDFYNRKEHIIKSNTPIIKKEALPHQANTEARSK
ncbi:MAG: hypothetical protein R2685_07925 [Candidatus Nitrosocosmicus sp.]|nr:hypothetical protein [Candidatus Nitrosocosmicus sp.]